MEADLDIRIKALFGAGKSAEEVATELQLPLGKINDIRIKALHGAGKSAKEIASELQLQLGKVYQAHTVLGLAPNKQNNERHNRILKFARENPELGYPEIGKLLGCTRQNVSHVCREHGIIRKDNRKVGASKKSATSTTAINEG